MKCVLTYSMAYNGEGNKYINYHVQVFIIITLLVNSQQGQRKYYELAISACLGELAKNSEMVHLSRRTAG